MMDALYLLGFGPRVRVHEPPGARDGCGQQAVWMRGGRRRTVDLVGTVERER